MVKKTSPVDCAVTESTDGKPGCATNGWEACNDGVTTVAGMLKGGSVEEACNDDDTTVAGMLKGESVEDTSEADTRVELSVTN